MAPRRPRERDHQAVVVAAVTGVPTETDDHPAVGQRQRRALQLVGGGGHAGRIDHLVQQDRARIEIESDQVVGRPTGNLFRRHDEDLVAGGVDHRCRGDPHRGLDVTAQTGHGGGVERSPDVGGPQHRARICRQRVHGVVLGGGVDPTGGHEWLSEEAAVEGGRGPGRSRAGERGPRRVDSGPQPVLVEGRPRGGRGHRGCGCGRAGRQRWCAGGDDDRSQSHQEDETGTGQHTEHRSGHGGGLP